MVGQNRDPSDCFTDKLTDRMYIGDTLNSGEQSHFLRLLKKLESVFSQDEYERPWLL